MNPAIVSKEAKRRRSIYFDLDSKALEKYHPSHGYSQIRKYMESKGFIHRQYSVYESKAALTHTETVDILDDLFDKYDWIEKCCQRIDMAIVNKKHDYLAIRKEAAQKAEELKNEHGSSDASKSKTSKSNSAYAKMLTMLSSDGEDVKNAQEDLSLE